MWYLIRAGGCRGSDQQDKQEQASAYMARHRSSIATKHGIVCGSGQNNRCGVLAARWWCTHHSRPPSAQSSQKGLDWTCMHIYRYSSWVQQRHNHSTTRARRSYRRTVQFSPVRPVLSIPIYSRRASQCKVYQLLVLFAPAGPGPRSVYIQCSQCGDEIYIASISYLPFPFVHQLSIYIHITYMSAHPHSTYIQLSIYRSQPTHSQAIYAGYINYSRCAF